MKKPNNKAEKRFFDIPQHKSGFIEFNNFHVIYNTKYHGIDVDKGMICKFGCLVHISATQLHHLLPHDMGKFKKLSW